MAGDGRPKRKWCTGNPAVERGAVVSYSLAREQWHIRGVRAWHAWHVKSNSDCVSIISPRSLFPLEDARSHPHFRSPLSAVNCDQCSCAFCGKGSLEHNEVWINAKGVRISRTSDRHQSLFGYNSYLSLRVAENEARARVLLFSFSRAFAFSLLFAWLWRLVRLFSARRGVHLTLTPCTLWSGCALAVWSSGIFVTHAQQCSVGSTYMKSKMHCPWR